MTQVASQASTEGTDKAKGGNNDFIHTVMRGRGTGGAMQEKDSRGKGREKHWTEGITQREDLKSNTQNLLLTTKTRITTDR